MSSERPTHPLEKLREKGEEARKRGDQERVHCPECETTVWKDSLEDAVETAETHDEKRHDGKQTTKVNGMVLPSDALAEAVEEAMPKLRGEDHERNVSHVGPIVFSNDTARGQLEEYGEVVTFRPDDRTTGDTWWRKSRTGEKQGDVHVEFAGHVCPHGTGSGLKPHVDMSGFNSAADWQAAIRALHGGMPSEGALYRVTEGHNE